MTNTVNIDHWNVIGHDWAVRQIQIAFNYGRVRHAYLIQGASSIGKTTFAKSIAMALNCIDDPKPCGVCRPCRLILDNKHPDIEIIEAERVGGTLKIDQIRELQHKLSRRPYEGKYRVAILRRFQEAQAAAQNAILKTLEEPAGNVVLILTAEEPADILPTIHSRCQPFNLRPLSVAETTNALKNNWQVADDEARFLGHLSGGRLGWAVKCVEDEEQLEFRDKSVELIEKVLESNRLERFNIADDMGKDRTELTSILDYWQTYWRDIMLIASGSQALLINVDRESAMISYAQSISVDDAQAAVQAIREAIFQISRNVNQRLALEVLMLQFPYVN